MATGKVVIPPAPLKNDNLLPDTVRGYVEKHRIDLIVTDALNDVVKHLPEDPMGHLAVHIAKGSGSAPRFAAMRRDDMAPASDLRFDIIVKVRGVRVSVHTFSFKGKLYDVDEEIPADEEDLALKREKAQNHQQKVADFLEKYFISSFGDVPVDDYLTFGDRCAGLANLPCGPGETVNMVRATAAFTVELLVAAARASDSTTLDFLQQVLADLDLASAPLRTADELASWAELWLHLAMPVFRGGEPGGLRPASLRCCAALSPMGFPNSGPMPLPDGCPPLGWAKTVGETLKGAIAEAVKLLQADKASAGLVVEGKCYAHPEGLGKTLELTLQAAKSALPADCTAEPVAVLLAAADEAWVEDEGVYELEAGKKLDLEQLVEFYAEVAEAAAGALQFIVQPFRPDDMRAGCELLRSRRPELKLGAFYGEDMPPKKSPKDARYSCALPFAGPAPVVLQRYATVSPGWQDEAEGCGSCLMLGAPTEVATGPVLPSNIIAAMACREARFLVLQEGAELDGASQRCDEVLERLIYP